MAARATRMSTSSSAPPSARQRLTGSAELVRALDAGLPVRCVVVPEGALPAELSALCERAAAAGAEILRSGERRQTRLAGDADVAALVGPERDGDLDAVMARGGAVWLIVGARYPGNVGTAIRTAEVSGADGVYIDCAFDHAQRREARRASMRADRFLPVAWERAGDVIGAARRAGKRIVAVEDNGSAAPWEISLAGPVLFVAGGESDGIPAAVQRRCDAVTRIPMEGFVSSYNLQAAVAIVAAERLRQCGGSR
jgi:tRNA G18 (ribose-2'-O)-methylase SpoU